jgi:hypothetical protein
VEERHIAVSESQSCYQSPSRSLSAVVDERSRNGANQNVSTDSYQTDAQLVVNEPQVERIDTHVFGAAHRNDQGIRDFAKEHSVGKPASASRLEVKIEKPSTLIADATFWSKANIADYVLRALCLRTCPGL